MINLSKKKTVVYFHFKLDRFWGKFMHKEGLNFRDVEVNLQIKSKVSSECGNDITVIAYYWSNGSFGAIIFQFSAKTGHSWVMGTSDVSAGKGVYHETSV